MKKLFTILLIIFLGYSTAYLFVGKSKGYKFIQNKSNFELENILKDFGNFLDNIGKKKVSAEDSILSVEFFNRGMELYQEKNYEDAVWSFYDAVRKNPYNKEALYWNGKLEYMLKSYYSAEEIFDKLIDIDYEYKYDSVYFYLGIIYYEQKYYDDAIDKFSIFLEKHPESVKSIDYTAWSYFHGEYEYEEAIKTEEKIFEFDENSAMAYNSIGYFYIQYAENTNDEYLKNKYYTQSITKNKKALSIEKKNPNTAYNIYYAYFQLNKLDSSTYFAKLAVKIDPKFDKAYGGLAQIYYNNKNYNQSIYYADKAILLNDSLEFYYYYRAKSYYNTNKFLEAADNFNKCHQLSDNPSYLIELANTYVKIDSNQKAINYYSLYITSSNINDEQKDSIYRIIEELDSK